MLITESWLKMNDNSQLVELCPPQYECYNKPRACGCGGGLVCLQEDLEMLSNTV